MDLTFDVDVLSSIFKFLKNLRYSHYYSVHTFDIEVCKLLYQSISISSTIFNLCVLDIKVSKLRYRSNSIRGMVFDKGCFNIENIQISILKYIHFYIQAP